MHTDHLLLPYASWKCSMCCSLGTSALTALLFFLILKKQRTHPYLQESAGCVVLPIMDVNEHASSDNVDVSEKIHLVFASHHGPNKLLQTRRALEVLAKLSRQLQQLGWRGILVFIPV